MTRTEHISALNLKTIEGMMGRGETFETAYAQMIQATTDGGKLPADSAPKPRGRPNLSTGPIVLADVTAHPGATWREVQARNDMTIWQAKMALQRCMLAGQMHTTRRKGDHAAMYWPGGKP